jgi:hypothetical protein
VTEPATNLNDIDISLLPPRVRQLIAAVGLPAAFNLFSSLGGTWVYVPHVATRSQLLGVLSKDQVQQLAQAFGGQSILIPMADKLLTQIRNIAIRLDRQTMNTNEVALKYSITRRRVEQICAEEPSQATRPDNNLPLF